MAFKKQVKSDDHEECRNDILRAVTSGSVSPADAERIAAKQGLPPFEWSPSTKDFDVHALKVWTLEMAVSWIIWRDAGKVITFNNQFRAEWRYWLRSTKSGGVRPDGKGQLPPQPTYRLENRQPATLADIQCDNRSILPYPNVRPSAYMSYNDALEALRAHLVDGVLEAHALEFDTIRSSAIPAHVWRYANLKVHGGVTCLFIDREQKPTFYKITFRTAEVLAAWTEQENAGPSLKASKEQRRLSDKVRLGRSPKFDWVAFDRQVFDILDEWGGIQLTADPLFNRARLRKEMGDWMAPQYKDSPSDATLKLHVKRAVTAYEQHVLERNR